MIKDKSTFVQYNEEVVYGMNIHQKMGGGETLLKPSTWHSKNGHISVILNLAKLHILTTWPKFQLVLSKAPELLLSGLCKKPNLLKRVLQMLVSMTSFCKRNVTTFSFLDTDNKLKIRRCVSKNYIVCNKEMPSYFSKIINFQHIIWFIKYLTHRKFLFFTILVQAALKWKYSGLSVW